MIKVSGPKIQEVVQKVDGQYINGIVYTFTGKIQGIQATFTTNSENEEIAKDNLKKYLKQNMGPYRMYVEVV